jgi:hypothetical protein
MTLITQPPAPRRGAAQRSRRIPRLAALLIALCGATAPAADHEHHHTPTPVTTTPGTLSLDIFSTGPRLHLLTASGHPAVLHYQYSDDAGRTWSPPTPVGADQPAPSPVHRGMDAQIAASPDGKHLLAAWTTAGSQDRFGRGPIATALSSDAGRTWTPGPNPADDGQAAGHAFLDLAADARGSFHLVWLDGRDGSGKGLRYARSDDSGAHWTRNRTLDPATCECCWNTVAPSPDGRHLAVLYRDHGPRDMSLVTSDVSGHSWSSPTPVGAFHWDIDACPHTGGGLAFGPHDTLLATVWTGAGDRAGAYLLTSPDAGKTWSDPVRLGGDRRSWHTDVAADPATGRAAVVFDARTDTTPAVFAMTSDDSGRTWSSPHRLTPPGTTATNPRVVRTPAGFRAFWTQTTGDTPATWASVPLAK